MLYKNLPPIQGCIFSYDLVCSCYLGTGGLPFWKDMEKEGKKLGHLCLHSPSKWQNAVQSLWLAAGQLCKAAPRLASICNCNVVPLSLEMCWLPQCSRKSVTGTETFGNISPVWSSCRYHTDLISLFIGILSQANQESYSLWSLGVHLCSSVVYVTAAKIFFCFAASKACINRESNIMGLRFAAH